MLIAAVRFLHILAAVVWIGGMIFIALFLNPALRQGMNHIQRLSVLKKVAEKFKWGSWTAILVLAGSGFMNLRETLLEGKWSLQNYRLLMTAKLGLVGVVLAIAATHDFWLGPKLARQAETGEINPILRKGVIWMARTNLILALIVIYLVELAAHGLR